MIEQILKLDGSKMVRTSSNLIVKLIEEKFEDSAFKIITSSKNIDNVYILQNPAMIIAVEKNRNVKISFHIGVRSDIVYSIIMKFKEIKEIKKLDIATVFFYDVKESKIYYGDEAEEKMLSHLRHSTLNDFMHEHSQIMMLKNMRTPYIC